MANIFYEGLDLAYPQIAQLTEKCNRHNPGTKSFYIPTLMAYKNQSSKNDNPVPVNTSNLLNDDKNIGLNSYVLGSTIKLYIPQYIASSAPADEYGIIHPGVEFLVVFAGGDINRPFIIGGAWNG